MSNGANWKKLENRIALLFKEDNAMTTPGSGNSKGEEDVVGSSTICQCKYTEQKNITILAKDLERLKHAAKLLNKFPVFVNSANNEEILSIIISDDYSKELSNIVSLIIVMSQIKEIETTAELPLGLNDLNILSKDVMCTSRLFGRLLKRIKNEINLLENKVDSKIMDAASYNLFDGVKDAPQF